MADTVSENSHSRVWAVTVYLALTWIATTVAAGVVIYVFARVIDGVIKNDFWSYFVGQYGAFAIAAAGNAVGINYSAEYIKKKVSREVLRESALPAIVIYDILFILFGAASIFLAKVYYGTISMLFLSALYYIFLVVYFTLITRIKFLR